MQVLGNVMDHFWRVKLMAKATHVDLVGALGQGAMSHEDWADIVNTCRGCTWAAKCDQWLSHNETAVCAPETCLNRARFDAVRACAESA